MTARAIVFDIDDTLYLERDYVLSGFRAADEWATQTLELPGLAERCWSLFLSGVRGNIFDLALRESGIDPLPDLVLELRDVYRQHTPDIRLAPDVASYLDLVSEAVRMGAVTDGPLDSQRAKARALGLERWLAPIIFTEQLGVDYRKPNQRAFSLIQTQLDCESSGCVYVADNPAKDFSGPASLGWRTCRVRRPGSLHEAISSGPDVQLEVRDLLELLEVSDSGLPSGNTILARPATSSVERSEGLDRL
jgi:putative hydrolase of the HAD superfamily